MRNIVTPAVIAEVTNAVIPEYSILLNKVAENVALHKGKAEGLIATKDGQLA